MLGAFSSNTLRRQACLSHAPGGDGDPCRSCLTVVVKFGFITIKGTLIYHTWRRGAMWTVQDQHSLEDQPRYPDVLKFIPNIFPFCFPLTVGVH